MAGALRRLASMLGIGPKREEPASLEAGWLVVGLGNPGAGYAHTRHNAGRRALERLAAEEGAAFHQVSGIPAEVAQADLGEEAALLVRPTTYMNTSGEAVGPLAERLGVAPERIVVLHDELDLAAGRVRIKAGGSDNGHNGLKSLALALGSAAFPRVRVGIGRPPRGTSVPDYVLAPEAAPDDDAEETAALAARLVVAEGLARAQHRIHSRRS